jgi:hypothetical protein
MGIYKNELMLDFSEISMQNKIISDKEKISNKILSKIKKHNFKYKNKILNDKNLIIDLVQNIKHDEQLNLISKAFDSPNIINSFTSEIKNIYIATWSITPSGIDSLVKIVDNKKLENGFLLLDKSHSYKWIFNSGAYKILRGKIKIRLLANHSKFICFETDSGVYNFIGSMNLSNNPRFENITINRNREDFDFYSNFVKTVKAEDL